MVSNAVIAKSWGLTAKDIKTMTIGTGNTYFLNVTASNGDIVSGFSYWDTGQYCRTYGT